MAISDWLDLVWDEHGLFRGGCEACLPGKSGDQISNAIMSAGVSRFGATRSVSPIRVKDMLALFTPRGGSRIAGLCILISGCGPAERLGPGE